MTFEVTLRDRTTETIDGVDGYQQEGQMTTFFQHGSGRRALDSWSTRVASVRTAEILVVRRLDAASAARRDLRSA